MLINLLSPQNNHLRLKTAQLDSSRRRQKVQLRRRVESCNNFTLAFNKLKRDNSKSQRISTPFTTRNKSTKLGKRSFFSVKKTAYSQSNSFRFLQNQPSTARLLNQTDIIDNCFQFEDQVLSNLYSFKQKFINQQYQHSREVIVKLLNYALDYNLPNKLGVGLRILADSYFILNQYSEALYYYNQARYCFLLIDNAQDMIKNMVKMSNCCCRSGLEKESIKILKKALEYSWVYGLTNCEIELYDEIGKSYYLRGQCEKAKQYHHKYLNYLFEPKDSALKSISKQQIFFNQRNNILTRFSEITSSFLSHLHIPIRTIQEIPLPFSDRASIRSNYKIRKFYLPSTDIHVEIKVLFKSWFFIDEISDVILPNIDSLTPKVNKNFVYINFQLNQRVKSIKQNRQFLRGQKNNVTQVMKTSRVNRQKSNEIDWYQKMVKQVTRDHKNKLLGLRNAVKISGMNKLSKPSEQKIEEIFRMFILSNDKDKSNNG